MKHTFHLRVGPASFRIGSAWAQPIDQLRTLYNGYPTPEHCDFTVRLAPEKPWRRWLRPSVSIGGDFMLPDAAPLSLAHGLLAAEMGMNLQMALGQRRYLILHAASVEKHGRAVILTGESGSGKSTLAAMLGERGWRLMSDEFALLDLATGQLRAFPRAVSLKNTAISVMEGHAPADRFGPRLVDTPKGDIRHLRPRADAIARMDAPATPALILFPRFGPDNAIRRVGAAEVFMRLTQASTNYVALGGGGFDALTGLVRACPALAIDYPDGAAAEQMVDTLFAEAIAQRLAA